LTKIIVHFFYTIVTFLLKSESHLNDRQLSGESDFAGHGDLLNSRRKKNHERRRL